ncbi:LOW QUALITY PROTEIN: ATP-binding cassette sub-family C member 10 [Centruroides vittatus]|uniref:LOW QUALITY PROTEIN: ATP-binding cassette sub-family C member 10 n=1 Tax=Centruroides vittatus TaxID=120091 RepID=UPI00351080CB
MNVNWNWLCGPHFAIWDGHIFGRCFRQMTIIFPAYALFLIVCTYYIGKRNGCYLRIYHQLWVINCRIFLSVLLIICCVVRFSIRYMIAHVQLRGMDFLQVFITIVAWIVHILYLHILKTRLTPHSRGPLIVIICWILTLAVTVLDLRASVMTSTDTLEVLTERYSIGSSTGLQILYGLTLLFSNTVESSAYEEFSRIAHETEPLLSGNIVRYDSFQEARDPHSLGIAAENSSIISKLTLFWINKMMSKGAKNLLKNTDDLFDLPHSMQSSNVDAKITSFLQRICFKEMKDETCSTTSSNDTKLYKRNLLKALHYCFATEYYFLGILKIVSDALNFCGPLLLNYLVSYFEEKNDSISLGCYYAAGLFGVTLLNSFCSTHFSYLINCVGLKIRVSLITAVYRKILNVNKSTLSKFNSGEIVNFMNTDTDRVVNFCQSFHEVWSLPLQIAIALFLLYNQVGIAFVSGVVFAVLLVPINQKIASKIGKLSQLMMEKKDERIVFMKELLTGIRVIKMHYWEDVFASKITKFRKEELKYLKKRKYLDAFCVYFWVITPLVIAVLTFMTYVLQGKTLTAAKVFTCLALFNILILPLNAFPWVLNGLMEAWISLTRLEKFMGTSSFDSENYYSSVKDPMNRIEVCEGNFAWAPKSSNMPIQLRSESLQDLTVRSSEISSFKLESINFNVRKGQLIGVVGRVGSGKSTLISSIIGDVIKTEGTIAITEEDCQYGIGVVSQEPWIQQTTIQKNILFGKSFNFNRYKNVLEACALVDDLKTFPAEDETEIGDRGITLSGGQKARIALARAVYQDFDLYLLDDPFSAIDTNVSNHIFKNCIIKLLKNKTRLLCTHHVHFLSYADYILILDGGRIILEGVPEKVLQLDIVRPICCEEQFPAINDKNKLENGIQELEKTEDHDFCTAQWQNTRRTINSKRRKHQGSVKFHVYKSYWNAVGSCLSFFVLLSFFFMQASRTMADWWLSVWISCDSNHNRNNSINNFTILREFWSDRMNLTFSSDQGLCFDGGSRINGSNIYLIIYGSFVVINSIFTLLRAFLYAYCGICAAVVIHRRLLNSILKAPITFFDVTPLGRILNRFSTDVYNVDDSLPFILNILLAQIFSLAGSLTITCYGLPWLIILLIPLAAAYYFIQNYYRCTSRELKRLSSVSLSPVYTHISETLNGHTVIRTFCASSRFQHELSEKLDKNQQARFATMLASQWLNLRLQLIGVVIVTGVAFIAVFEHSVSSVDPSLVGLALSYALSVTGLLNGVVTYLTETEKEMVSVERTMQYIDGITPETTDGFEQVPFGWPTHGVISFSNVSLQYRRNLPYVLKNVSFETLPGENLGIVGRTGSGKSSLLQALFRLIEIDEGEIYIDGVNTAFLSLKDLRSHLSIIPQDPFLFNASVKENLDPKECFSETELWRALHHCHMEEEIKRLGGLNISIGEGGQIFSSGQKQLLCLARAILCKTKVLCLDEATSNIDYDTDSLIQKTIKSAFAQTTILTIAHRIETVRKCNRVIVMKDGKIVEFDNPTILLENPNSYFSQLAVNSNNF